MRVVLYARVSSEKQAEKDLSIPAQLKALRLYSDKRDWNILHEYVDEAESARSANRPSFQKMIRLAKEKAFDVILVWKLSRFARNREDSIVYKSLLRKYGVKVISINEQLDDTPAGKLLEGVIESIDEFYSANLAEDVKRGMRENASRGFFNGGTVPAGYRVQKVQDGANQKSVLVINEDFAPVIKMIFDYCLQGLGAKEITKELNSAGIKTHKGKEWNKNSILYLLKNPLYMGQCDWNSEQLSLSDDGLIPCINPELAIIDEFTFKKVQNLIAQRSPKVTPPSSINSAYLLSNLVVCGHCGGKHKMVGASAKGSKYFYYSCQNLMKKGRTFCSSKALKKEKLESLIIHRLQETVLTEENLTELVKLINQEITLSKEQSQERDSLVQSQIDDLNKRLNKLFEAIESGVFDLKDLAPRIKELRNQIDQLEIAKTELLLNSTKGSIQFMDKKTVKKYVADLQLLLTKGSLIEQKGFLKSFIKKVEVNFPEIKVEYTLPLKLSDSMQDKEEVLYVKQSGGP